MRSARGWVAPQLHDYDGCVVVESDQSPHVEESVMLNGWYKRQILSKI